MIILGDYHTHTTYSHGKNSVMENAISAEQKGLAQIAITDHGFAHPFYGLKRREVESIRKDIADCNFSRNIKVLYGIEANLIGTKGEVDLTDFDKQKMDIILLGYHFFGMPVNIKSWLSMYVANSIFRPTKSQIQRNTDSYLYAIDNNEIDVLTHLNYGMLVNVKQIAKLANQTNTMIELNGKRTLFNQDEVDEILASGAKFIINSDAHSSKNVGNITLPYNFAITHKIPLSKIVNLNELYIPKNHKLK